MTMTTTPTTIRNTSDYQFNSDCYQSLTGGHYFDQADNLRLDRPSSPQFQPVSGKSLIYLRRQYCMPDLRGSTTTLHWLDIEINKTIQFTQPIWAIHDQQLRTEVFPSSGFTQIFQLTLPADVSLVTNFIDPIQIINYPLDIDNLLVNRQAKRLVFGYQVYANLNIEETAA
ncbi:unnamed protein product [Rotaria sp. Silwood2]|nr:unnamed protein product [Rotaria sp. Silwood2]CAF2826153.1 unnamed protein product [Rotaria sp. Silwood2]CAF2987200.1 unnamed protein product [Rotaria sp. Silwood2]CAF3010159.1 unnamed protein product [Rotaria sp. Silwood2]CAF4092065.1 unnamed protein product [Rotaria sp. Silwood2]